MMVKKVLETPEGKAMHLEKSKKGNAAARLVCLKKISYNNVVYHGWKEFEDMTGITKYVFKKYNMGEILN